MEDFEKKWEENIAEAKTIVSSKNFAQMEVARLCCEVCEINRGGPKYESVFTVVKFAKEVGITYKTLSLWVATYRNVFKKLDSELRARSSYTNCATISKKINSTATEAEVRSAMRKHLSTDCLDAKLMRYAASMRSLAHNFEQKDVASVAKTQVLEEILFYCELVINNIRKNSGRKLSGKFHGITSTYDIRSGNSPTSGALFIEDSLGFKVKLSSIDQKAIKIIKDKKEITPTELGDSGVYVKGTKMAKKLSALRTLQKLESLDLVKNNKGSYLFLKDLKGVES